MTNQKLAAAITHFLQESIDNSTIGNDSVEGIQVAIQCIEEAFGIESSDPSLSIAPNSLQKIFSAAIETETKPDPSVSPEELKTLGNKAMAAKDYNGAIKHYTAAINADPTNAVFYANRAAAYSLNNQHQLAVEDSNAAVGVDPGYSKAYSRMGHAHFCLGEYEKAVEAYEKGCALDPGNTTMKQSLEAAKQKVGAVSRDAGMAGSSSGGMPAGMPDLSGMLNNPALMQMASQMMSNPNMASMLNNPDVMNMAKSFMSNPQASEMLRDPEALSKAMGALGKK